MDECLLGLRADWRFNAATVALGGGVWGATMAVPCLQFTPIIPSVAELGLPTGFARSS